MFYLYMMNNSFFLIFVFQFIIGKYFYRTQYILPTHFSSSKFRNASISAANRAVGKWYFFVGDKK